MSGIGLQLCPLFCLPLFWRGIFLKRCKMAESKSKTQQAYMRKNFVRFPLDLKPDVLEKFRTACEKNGTKPTTEIKKFIDDYIASAGE